MSHNRHLPHLVVLPEDDANADIARGFQMSLPPRDRQFRIAALAGGWLKLRDKLEREYLPLLQKYSSCHVVALVDHDGKGESRRNEVMRVVTDEVLRSRIFILGAAGEPEALKKTLGSFETIGKRLATDCAEGKSDAWNHPLLAHNQDELERMIPVVRPIFFA